jgi:hypothetical protein
MDITAYFKGAKKIVTPVKQTSPGMDLKNEKVIFNFKDAMNCIK